jgi:ComF family protein
MFITRHLKQLYTWLMPYTCVLCHHPSNRKQDLCEPCHRELPMLTHNCPRCARELSIELICGECLKHPPPFDATYALFSYVGLIQRLILSLKFNSTLIHAKILGELLADHLANQKMILPSVIIPVPLHHKRIKERGFNQAIEIARPIAKRLSLPINTTACKRIKPTLAQATLSAEKRKENIKQAFEVTDNFAEAHIAILDDVITTGHTITEIAHTFKNAGVRRIDVWCVAKVLSSSTSHAGMT